MTDQASGKNGDPAKDSFDVPVKRSPLFLFAMLQIPLVIIMVIMIYVLYQSQFS
jgi:hypothetical protein